MDGSISELLSQAGRVFLLLLVPGLIIPVVAGVSSMLLGLIGVRDDGLAYGVRVVAAVLVGAAFVPACAGDVIDLMRMALR